MPNRTSTRSVNARFPGAPSKPSEFVGDLRQIVNNAKQSADWSKTPQVQTAINALDADADSIEETALQIDKIRKQIAQAETALAAKIVTCKQHRKHAEATITVASKGSVVAVKGWGCAVAGRTLSTPTDEAPQRVTAKNTRTPGNVVARCKGLRASAYVFQHADDPTFPPGSPAPVVLPNSAYQLTGLPAGQKIYFRVAVIRRVIGQSKWSEPVQLTVR